MTPIQILLEIGIPEGAVAQRLQVAPDTLSLWRSGVCHPTRKLQDIAFDYLTEIQKRYHACLTRIIIAKARAKAPKKKFKEKFIAIAPESCSPDDPAPFVFEDEL